MYSDCKALRVAFENLNIHGRLSRWLGIMTEYDIEIRHVQSKQNLLVNYISQSVGVVAVEEDGEDRYLIEQYFCKHAKEGLQMTELVVTISRNPELEGLLKIVEIVLVSEYRTRTPVPL